MLTVNKAVAILCRYILAGILLIGCVGVAWASVRFEHLAINVDNPKKVADWYVTYVGLKIISESKNMIFVGDPDHHFMFELYNKAEAKGSYSDLSHPSSHFAFATDDADGLAKKMVEGGAKILKKFQNPVGDTVINMTDPGGNNLQVIHRVKPKL